MLIVPFYVKGISHSSYLIAGDDTCAVVDPQRHVDIYLDAAKNLGVTITHILETHLHADFISGHMDLAARTGADIYAPASAGCRFDHIPLSEGHTFNVESMQFLAMETPGHTPEHMVYVVTDLARGKDPVGVFSGDTLFVGDVGRPDLFPGRAGTLSEKLFHSLHDKLLQLPDSCEVYPAHGAGSLCGKAMAAKRRSTIGYERRNNKILAIKNPEEFRAVLLDSMPPAPDHFSRCTIVNTDGPVRLAELPELHAYGPDTLKKHLESSDSVILDTRSYNSFGANFIPGSYHVDMGGNFATFAGWVVPPDTDIVLVADDEAAAREAAVQLRRVGLDRISGYLDGGLFAWSRAGFHSDHVEQVSPAELNAIANEESGDSRFTLIDVRAPGEYEGHHVKGSINIPAPDLRERHTELNPDMTNIVICGTGHRSSLAASLLKQHGFKNVVNAAGGMQGYANAGYGPECTYCAPPHVPRSTARAYSSG